MLQVDPTAIIDPKAELSEGVSVGPYSIIGPGVKIGRRTRIDSHVHIKGNTTIGEDNQFFHCCIVGEAPQDISFNTSPHSKLVIGDRNIFREFCQLHSSTQEEGTVIGNDNFFLSLTHVAHDVKVGNNCFLIQGAILGGHAVVEDYVYISAISAVHQHGRVGMCATIAGITGVSKDIPPFALVQGERATVRGLSTIAMRRAGIGAEARSAIKQAYQICFMQELSMTKGISRVEEEIISTLQPESEAYRYLQHFVAFIKASKRGVVGGFHRQKNSSVER